MNSIDNYSKTDRGLCSDDSNSVQKSKIDRQILDLYKQENVVYLDSSDKKVRRENFEVRGACTTRIFTAYQRIQVLFLICLAITNIIVFLMVFYTGK